MRPAGNQNKKNRNTFVAPPVGSTVSPYAVRGGVQVGTGQPINKKASGIRGGTGLYSLPAHNNPQPNQAGPHNANKQVEITGKWKNGAVGKWKKGAVGKWKKGGGAGGADEPTKDEEGKVHGSAETGTTGFAHQYSKSPYRTSQFAMGPGRMEFGKSGTGKKKQPEAPARNAPRQGKRKGRKAK